MHFRLPPISRRDLLLDIDSSVGFLTCLPTIIAHSNPRPQGAWAWPIIGAAIGAAAGAIMVALLSLNISHSISAVVVLALLAAVTGCLHEDGLADTADGLWGGSDAQRRLKIMRDSRIGTYGAAALILAFLARHTGIIEASAQFNSILFLAVAGAVSRALMVLFMSRSSYARTDGLAARFGRPKQQTAYLACGLAFIFALLAVGWAAFVVIPVAVVCAATLNLACRRLIGGVTGDTLGAIQQVAEIACLLCLAAL